jgi:hypothetical protein
MPNPFEEEFTAQNPIVAAASRIRARRELDKVLDEPGAPVAYADAESAFAAFGDQLKTGAKRLNAIYGERTGVKYIRIERPARIRLRFHDKRVSLDLDDVHQLVRVGGLDLEGEYQFAAEAGVPSLINLSKVSTEAGYGEPLTPSSLLKLLAQDAELPRPAHLDASGPLQF